jgi:hypothetical protein
LGDEQERLPVVPEGEDIDELPRESGLPARRTAEPSLEEQIAQMTSLDIEAEEKDRQSGRPDRPAK